MTRSPRAGSVQPMIVGLLVPLGFFAMCAAIALRILEHVHARRMRQLELQAAARMPQLPAADPAIETRLRNLESIVCSVDFELNNKLNRLASQQLQIAAASRSQALAAGEAGHSETAVYSLGSIAAGSRVAGRFLIEARLGQGGMGAVFRARDEQLGETVALKMIAGAALLDPAAAERFRREASAARRISHENVVRLHDLGEAHGMLFLSMEYIDGQSLLERVARSGALPCRELRPIAAQICSGLEAAHRAGVVHRDLKPHNVLLGTRDTVKIIDFGLAHLAHIEGMTATGLILGTPEYMAPEQVRGRPCDARTDLYALGAVLYHALTGRPPFTGDSAIAVGFAHCTERLVPPHEVRPDVPVAWSDLVIRAMQKDPAARFSSAAELGASLPA